MILLGRRRESCDAYKISVGLPSIFPGGDLTTPLQTISDLHWCTMYLIPSGCCPVIERDFSSGGWWIGRAGVKSQTDTNNCDEFNSLEAASEEKRIVHGIWSANKISLSFKVKWIGSSRSKRWRE